MKTKRFISLLLISIFIVNLVPICVFADTKNYLIENANEYLLKNQNYIYNFELPVDSDVTLYFDGNDTYGDYILEIYDSQNNLCFENEGSIFYDDTYIETSLEKGIYSVIVSEADNYVFKYMLSMYFTPTEIVSADEVVITTKSPFSPMPTGASGKLSATVSPNYTTNKTIKWSSSNPNVATVKAGTVKASNLGKTTITAKCDNAFDDYEIIVSETSISAITGQKLSLAKLVKNIKNYKKGTWKSLSEKNASVDKNGNLTVKAANQAKIKYTAQDGTAYYINVKIKDVSLNYTKAQIIKGKKIKLKLKNTSGKIKWQTSNPKVAKVNSKGVVKGKKLGTSNITATYQGVKYTCKVKVFQTTINTITGKKMSLLSYVKNVKSYKKGTWKSLNKENATVDKKGNLTVKKSDKATIQFKAKDGTLYYINLKIKYVGLNHTVGQVAQGKQLKLKLVNAKGNIKWNSSNPNIAKVTAKGVVKGLQIGTVNITATYKGVKFTNKIIVYKTSTQAIIGQKLSLLNIVKNVKNYNMGTWASTNQLIATVDSKGTLTAKASGKVTIQFKAKDGTYYLIDVKIINVFLNKTSSQLYKDSVLNLHLNNATGNVTWKSSNTNIATVSSNGVVKGVGIGTANITATYQGVNFNCAVTVKTKPLIDITDFYWEHNYADGIEPCIEITNYTNKTIKYIDFNAYYYNSVLDPAYCEIYDVNYSSLTAVGPLYSNKSETFYWDPVMYCNNVGYIRIKNVVITYMDGTTQKVTYDNLWRNSYYD